MAYHSVFLCSAAAVTLLAGRMSAAPQSPVVAGLHRQGLTPRLRGLILLGELGCTNCHAAAASSARAAAIRTKAAPRLFRVGERVFHDYLRSLLADPQARKPGTTMPDVLPPRGSADRVESVENLTHFLVSMSELRCVPELVDRTAARRGHAVFHEVGCAACHAPRGANGKERSMVGAVPLGQLAPKYSVASLTGFLEAPHQVRPSGRMPSFELTPKAVRDLSHFLLQGTAPAASAPAFRPLQVDPKRVAAGKVAYSKLGCVRCHDLGGQASGGEDEGMGAGRQRAKKLADLDATRGCLSAGRGVWPFFALDAAQRRDIRAALSAEDLVRSNELKIRQALATFNCIACHQRGTFGGIEPSRDEFFVSHDENLGEPGRLPPPLTGVGAKLQAKWLRDAISHGQAIRPYVKTHMPGFGAALGGRLAVLFGRVDRLPALPLPFTPLPFTPLPKNRKQARAVRDIGHTLAGDKGMNCIACHTFGGRRAAAMAAVDLVASTGQRLRKEWFYRFVRNPLQFRPDVVMPQFFPGGVSVRPDVAGGDRKQQIEGLWYYLAQGRNTRRPSGIVWPSMVISVGDEAVMLRRNVQGTGKRGISVGYPFGVNLTFDAESLALNQVWWGKFLDAAPVWTGQGSGQARILSRDRVDLGKGPQIAMLPTVDAPWPTPSRRDLGHRFMGYSLDTKQRPTFRYRCHGVEIRDRPTEVKVVAETGAGARAGAERPILRRTVSFRALPGTVDKTLSFRVAVHVDLADRGSNGLRIGNSHVLRIRGASYRVRTAGKLRELIVAVPLRRGRAEVVIDYVSERRSR